MQPRTDRRRPPILRRPLDAARDGLLRDLLGEDRIPGDREQRPVHGDPLGNAGVRDRPGPLEASEFLAHALPGAPCSRSPVRRVSHATAAGTIGCKESGRSRVEMA